MDEFETSNAMIGDAAALRARSREEGYLFFRSLIDTDAIREVRREILSLCSRAGWTRPRTDPADGIAAEGATWVEPQPEFMAVYNQVMRLESFHALAHDPALVAMFDSLFGEPTLVHPRNIARIIFPQNVKFTTPAHQDYIHIQGTEETWTAWIPVGDCPRELGGLAILPGSHRSGIYPVRSAYGAGGLGIDTEELPFQWLTTNYRLGDAVVFHSHTIHKGLPNLTQDRIRVSVDFRYQGVSQPVTEGSLLPHYAQLTWDDIYAGWTSKRFQYYWRDLQPKLANWTTEYHERAERSDR